jgi:hypothetical protein
MLELLDERLDAAGDALNLNLSSRYKHAGIALSAAFLAACGGGGGGDSAPPAPVNTVAPTEKEAKKFVGQALLASTPAAVAEVQQNGYAKWIDTQFLIPATTTRWQWLMDAGFNAAIYQNSTAGFDQSVWKKLLSSPDELRQRMTRWTTSWLQAVCRRELLGYFGSQRVWQLPHTVRPNFNEFGYGGVSHV